jgi:hypothetical protein
LNDSIVVDSWNSSTAYSNVTISVPLGAYDLGFADIAAWLTTSIGPGTTSALAATNLEVTEMAVPNPGASIPNADFTTLFSGLFLPAGTYYLVVAGEDPILPSTDGINTFWIFGDPTSLIAASGVTIGPTFASWGGAVDPSLIDLAFGPDSTFATGDPGTGDVFPQASLSVTGTPVPEPSYRVPVCVLMASIAFARMRSLKAHVTSPFPAH